MFGNRKVHTLRETPPQTLRGTPVPLPTPTELWPVREVTSTYRELSFDQFTLEYAVEGREVSISSRGDIDTIHLDVSQVPTMIEALRKLCKLDTPNDET